ncbi:small basic protein [Mucisphaera sp.]|uniref:small basic protein n=1 Tax=Mucisphaera sp. TaxID=2913024 RepID=UPI003D12470E
MSLDSSLRSSAGLARHRNVLTRAERVAKMQAEGKFDEGSGDPLGLPKLANRKIVTGKATKKKKTTDEEAK